MAGETTSTVTADSALAYSLSNGVILSPNLPKLVLMGLCNEIDIRGEGSDTARVNSFTDLGVAGAGTEGTEYTTNEAIALETPVDFLVAEAAAIQRAVITNFALETQPGMGAADVGMILQTGSLEQKLALLGPYRDQVAFPVLEKREDDLCNLLDGFSNTVGTTTLDLTLTDEIAAIYTMKTLEPLHEDWVFVHTPNQIQELMLEVGDAGGGKGGSVWVNQGDLSFFNHRPDMPRNGFRGSLMGIPVYEYAHSLRTTANGGADVCGALMCRGVGDPRKGGQVGGIGLAQLGFLKWHFEYGAGLRGAILVCSSDHKALEVRNTHGVSIITDAP